MLNELIETIKDARREGDWLGHAVAFCGAMRRNFHPVDFFDLLPNRWQVQMTDQTDQIGSKTRGSPGRSFLISGGPFRRDLR
jgi:hypothetical protein